MKRWLLVPAVVTIVAALVGALAGVGWWAWWQPAPLGEVIQRRPFFLPDEEFRSTGTFVVIAAPLGLVLGLLGSWWLRRRDPLLSLVAVMLGAAAATVAMLVTGWVLGPGSALEFARTARDGTVVRAGLRVEPGVAWLALPLATAFACLGFLLSRDPGESDESGPDRG